MPLDRSYAVLTKGNNAKPILKALEKRDWKQNVHNDEHFSKRQPWSAAYVYKPVGSNMQAPALGLRRQVVNHFPAFSVALSTKHVFFRTVASFYEAKPDRKVGSALPETFIVQPSPSDPITWGGWTNFCDRFAEEAGESSKHMWILKPVAMNRGALVVVFQTQSISSGFTRAGHRIVPRIGRDQEALQK